MEVLVEAMVAEVTEPLLQHIVFLFQYKKRLRQLKDRRYQVHFPTRLAHQSHQLLNIDRYCDASRRDLDQDVLRMRDFHFLYKIQLSYL